MSPNEEQLDPRVRRTRALIEDAFNALLGEQGFEEITVRDVTARARVNRATFYAHFHDKYALLDYTMRRRFRQRLGSGLPADARYSAANLHLLILALCNFLFDVEGQCRRIQRQFEALMEAQAKEVIRDILIGWMTPEDGVVSGRVEMAATVASWSIYGAALYWNTTGRTQPAEEFARTLLPMITAGLDQVRGLGLEHEASHAVGEAVPH